MSETTGTGEPAQGGYHVGLAFSPPDDRSDLVEMGRWVQAVLDARGQLVHRTVVRRLVDEVESLRAAIENAVEDLNRGRHYDAADRLTRAAAEFGGPT